MSEVTNLSHTLTKSRRSPDTDLDNDVSGSNKRLQSDGRELCCPRCRHMFSEAGLEELNSDAGLRHWDFTECCRFAMQGCETCRFIILTIGKSHGPKWAGDEVLAFRNRATACKSMPSSIDVLEGRLSTGAVVITMYPYAEQGNPAGRLIRRRPLRRDVKSKKVLAAASRIYTECKESHVLCRYAKDNVLPSRVLDVGTVLSPTLKLFVNDTEEYGQYLALSYCWGGPQRGLLRRQTLDSMTSEIRPETLQQTVKDAISVTRRLGFRYLWVDALCIIQDCRRDKEKEIGRMATIYKNAAMTISAGTAARAADGFLSMESTYLPDERFEIPVPNGERGTVYLRAGTHVPKHAVDERGWVLQEFLLSSRMLVFSEYELLWQCKEIELHGVVGGGLEYLQPLQGLPWTVFREANESAFGVEDTERRYMWKTIVEQYTIRQLGDMNDRLNALQGITRELETLWNDSTRFGLWEKWFVELLAWSKRGCEDEESGETVRENRAPTWSWGSLNGRIRYMEMFKREDAKVQQSNLLEGRVSKHVELKCKALKHENIDPALFEGAFDEDPIDGFVKEYYDLSDGADEVGNKSLQYLLLGTTQEGKTKATLGAALMVVEAPGGFHRRVGLATFKDMVIWKVAELKTIRLE
ncbi:hypothetical protein CCHL11_08067 [Colletotrichum chlorophyti]|uniref:Heterokaryon incompatibility domain-containing protein n=1 Tax=Colletotrichum chlorophyti TaxID=708187 RepID=A0A1Q8RMD2_9PEZI|nr:hypothetical protein CCHL11_08067 [Colletotrichum chlorophyti]